jgi:hypothetical protein
MILIGAAALMGLVAMNQKGRFAELFAVASLAIAVLVLLNVVFNITFGLSVI